MKLFGFLRGVPPTVTAITPSSGAKDVTTAITNLAGSGFVTGATVKINGVACTSVTVVSSTQITCAAPVGTVGAQNVVVTNPDTQTSGTSGNGLFTYLETVLLDVDFTALALGGIAAASFLSSTGLTFTRATVSTVQTSASAIDVTPAIDSACIGNCGSGKGLVVQQNTHNYFVSALGNRNLTSGWNAGTGTTTAAFADSPDGSGTGCSRANCASGTYANYGNISSSSRYCISSWQRSKDATTNGSMQMGWINASPGDGTQVKRAASNTWGRLSMANGTAARNYFDVCDARDYSGSGGDTAKARDVLVDYIQREVGDWPSEVIATTNTYRSPDIVSKGTGSSLITATNRVRFYAKMIPKFASSMQVWYDGSGGSGAAAAWYLFSWGANGQNYAKIKDADKKLYVKLANGTEAVSTNAVTFSQYDTVEWDIQVGNNVASVARYKLSGGSWVDLVLGAINNVPAPGGGAVGMLYNDNGTAAAETGHFPCWLQRLAFWTDAGNPP